MKKRFLSLLLVLVLIMSLMPAALAVNADDAQPKTISVTFRLHTDTDEWIAPTEVSDLPEGTSVKGLFLLWAKAAFTVTSPVGMVKVYLPLPLLDRVTVLPVLSRVTATLSSA